MDRTNIIRGNVLCQCQLEASKLLQFTFKYLLFLYQAIIQFTTYQTKIYVTE